MFRMRAREEAVNGIQAAVVLKESPVLFVFAPICRYAGANSSSTRFPWADRRAKTLVLHDDAGAAHRPGEGHVWPSLITEQARVFTAPIGIAVFEFQTLWQADRPETGVQPTNQNLTGPP